jgi:CRISPR associated protein Cas1
MSTQPLYLTPSEHARISIDAGVALRIEFTAKPNQRIPLLRISRIVSGPKANWESQALIHCMRKGIPISFIDRHGDSIGWCFGNRRVESTLATLLANALDCPEWSRLFNDWYQSEYRVNAAQVLMLCATAASEHNVKNARSVLCNQHKILHASAVGEHLDRVAFHARNELAAQLASDCSNPELLFWYRPGLNLVEVLGDILALWAHVSMQSCARLPSNLTAENWAMRQYEKQFADWARRIGQLLGSFEHFLRRHWL